MNRSFSDCANQVISGYTSQKWGRAYGSNYFFSKNAYYTWVQDAIEGEQQPAASRQTIEYDTSPPFPLVLRVDLLCVTVFLYDSVRPLLVSTLLHWN